MTESISDIQHARALKSLLAKGIAATALGVCFALAPQLIAEYLRPFGPAESLATGIRICGLVLLVIGLAALGMRHSVRNRMRKLSSLRRVGIPGDRLCQATRGSPLGPTHGFPVTSDAEHKPTRQGQVTIR